MAETQRSGLTVSVVPVGFYSGALQRTQQYGANEGEDRAHNQDVERFNQRSHENASLTIHMYFTAIIVAREPDLILQCGGIGQKTFFQVDFRQVIRRVSICCSAAQFVVHKYATMLNLLVQSS